MKALARCACVALLWCLLPRAGADTNASVDVILWFDTEDYLLPADDDASRRLAEMLTQRGIRATFKMVGEKARVLEQRGRHDVIAALKKHDIGYHSDFHSVHPTPSEYLADCGWQDGVAEFVRHERKGAADVRRIFQVETLSCYGQPGSSWAPQTFGALADLRVTPHGVPCYVDEGSHVGLDNKPFWYAGALVVYHMGRNYTRMELHDPAAVAPARQKVSEMAGRLRAEGGGLISIFYHPCEWVHREFWDGVNFRRGANPPRELWKPPPQRTAEETEGAFRRFGEYVDYIRAIPGIRFVTAADLPLMYPDPVRAEGASKADLDEIASRLSNPETKAVDFVLVGHRAYSVADQFELLNQAVGELVAGRQPAFPLKTKGLLGPDSTAPPSRGPGHLDWPAFRDSATDVRDFVRVNQRIPARVFIGPDAMPPGDFLLALASAYDFDRRNGKLPFNEGVMAGKGIELLPEKQVAKDNPGLFGGWIIHPEGFRAPKILELARLQAWTLKPAVRGN